MQFQLSIAIIPSTCMGYVDRNKLFTNNVYMPHSFAGTQERNIGIGIGTMLLIVVITITAIIVAIAAILVWYV